MDSNLQFNFQNNMWALVSFLSYILILLIIGLFSTKFSSKGMKEFFLGGREMNKYVVALSAVVSGRSSWLLIGATGMAFVYGIAAVWAVIGYIIVELLMFIYMAPKLRIETEKNGDITIPDYFSSRFKDKTNILRIISVTIILIFMVSYISAQFVGGGKAFSTGFGVEPIEGIVITAIIVLVYTLLGGFLAVSLTDVVQAIFMIFALIVIPAIAIFDLGGFNNMLIKLNNISPKLVDPFSLSIGAILGYLGIGLGSPGNPHILVRYMSIKKTSDLKFSVFIGTFWNVVMGWAAIYIGMAGRAMFVIQEQLPGADAENLFPFLAQQYLHPVLFGVVIAAILAAIMSTADSMLLVSASSIIRDIYQKIINPKKQISQKQMVFYSRIIILIIVLISFIIGIIAEKLVFWLVLFAWGGLGASFGPTILLALFWKKTNKNGIIAGFLSGSITVIIWNQALFLKSIIYELVPAFIISFIFTIIVSLLTRRKN